MKECEAKLGSCSCGEFHNKEETFVLKSQTRKVLEEDIIEELDKYSSNDGHTIQDWCKRIVAQELIKRIKAG